MSDAFDQAMADIAIKSAKNGGPTTQDVLVALKAGHDAAIETAAALEAKTEQTAATLAGQLSRIVSHLESESAHTTNAIRELTAQVNEHCTDTTAAIADLTAKREKVVAVQVPRIDRLEREVEGLDCIKFPRKAHRVNDPDDADYSDARFQSRFMWLVGGRIVYVVLAVVVAVLVTVINIGLNYLWFGTP